MRASVVSPQALAAGRRGRIGRGASVGVVLALLAACGDEDQVVVRKKSAGGAAGNAGSTATGGKGLAGASGKARGGAAGAGPAGAGGLGQGGTGGSASGTGGSAAGTGGSSAGTAGSVAGTGGSAGGSCIGADAPVGVPTKTMQTSSCSFADGLGDFAADQKVDSAALGESGGVLSLFLAVADQNSAVDLTVRRYVVDTASGCKLTRDASSVEPTDLACHTLSNDREGGVWCSGVIAGPKATYGFRRIWPTATPICVATMDTFMSTSYLVVDPTAKVVFGNSLNLRRWTYTDQSCVEDTALTTCVSGGGGIFGGAVDEQHHLHLATFNNRMAVVDAQGKNLFSYGDEGDPVASASACTTGVCGVLRNQSNLPLHLGGVDAKGALVVTGEVERNFFTTERTDFSSVGGRGILLLGEDDGTGFHVPTRVSALLVTGL